MKRAVSALAIALAGAAVLRAQGDARAAIEAANKQFIAAYAKGDAAALANVIWKREQGQWKLHRDSKVTWMEEW